MSAAFDKNLTWKEHIDNVASMLSKQIALLRRIKHYLPASIRIIYYKVFLQSIIDYCCTVWGQSTHIPRIFKLQKLALRLVYDKPRDASSCPLFKESRLLPIDYRVNYRITLMTYKAINGLAPDYISNMFNLLKSVSKRVTRNTTKNNLSILNYSLNLTRGGLPYSGAVLYNALPLAIRNIKSISVFK